MKKFKTTFVDSESTHLIGEPIDGVLVPVFVGMSFESGARVRYIVTEAELIDTNEALELFVTLKQSKVQ